MMFPAVGKVLIWTETSNNGGWDGGLDLDHLTDLRLLYTAMGVEVDDAVTWSGVLSDYSLIHFPYAISDPVWWTEISGNTWAGRLHITAETNLAPGAGGGGDDGPTSIAYVNGKSGITGVAVTSADNSVLTSGTAEADDLTAGQAVIIYDATTTVSGGTTLSKTNPENEPWLARNKPVGSLIDFVVSGDTGHMIDLNLPSNTSLFQNMYNVSV